MKLQSIVKIDRMKNIYVARIKRDKELLFNLSGPPRTGRIETWILLSKDVSWTAYVVVPDFNLTDTFCFDVLFDDDFRKENDVNIGDHFQMSIPAPAILRDIEIIDIKKGEPINNLENKKQAKECHYDVNELLSVCLYHENVLRRSGYWFGVDEIIGFISAITPFNLQTLELIVDKDEDHRYTFNDDRTMLRISPEHVAPKDVEEQMKTADKLKIKRSFFTRLKLPFIKDRKRCIRITCSNGGGWEFPFETNKIFYIDEKHFFVLIEFEGNLRLLVSSYMNKAPGRYRMIFNHLDKVLNNVYPVTSELKDYEDNIFTVDIQDV